MSCRGALLLCAFAFFTLAADATKVKKCKPGSGDLEDGLVGVSLCEGPPCRLRRKSEAVVTIKFTPETKIESLVTQVHADIAGIPFPFIGVDGKSVCQKIYTPDGKTSTPCPLEPGKTYLYKDSFKILEVYPKVKVNVHYALKDTKMKKQVACFELAAKITS